MKKKDLTGIRSKTKKELKTLADKKAVDLAKAKVAIKAGQEKNLKKIKLIRHEISQLLTVLREKEIVEKLDERVEKKPKIQRIQKDSQKTKKKERRIRTQKK